MNQYIHQTVQKLLIALISFVSGLITGVGCLNGFDLAISSIVNNNSLRIIVLSVLVLVFLIGIITVIKQTKIRT